MHLVATFYSSEQEFERNVPKVVGYEIDDFKIRYCRYNDIGKIIHEVKCAVLGRKVRKLLEILAKKI